MVKGNERILVVDDAASIRKWLSTALNKMGYHCVSVSSPDDAERALEREKFDLMLLDIGLPGKSGLEFLPEIHERYPELVVVMLTGRDDVRTAVSAMREGAYDYIAKPVPLSQLMTRLYDAMSRRELLLENKDTREAFERKVERFDQSRRDLLKVTSPEVPEQTGEHQPNPDRLVIFARQRFMEENGQGPITWRSVE